MRKLILHVGPGKCGSTTIQDFFRTHKQPCTEPLNFIFLDPKEIAKIGNAKPGKNSTRFFDKLIRDSIKLNPILILSHEFLFSKPNAISNICKIANDIVDKILIVGYSRRQSDYIISSYSQWHFRSLERINEINETLIKSGVNPSHFFGVEKQLIASISNDFYSDRQSSNNLLQDWYKSYKNLEYLIPDTLASLKCGTLPKKDSNKNLIEDFCDKSGLTIRNNFKNLTNSHRNLKFKTEIVEAINIAADLGLDGPSPHGHNDFLYTVSQLISTKKTFANDFILKLKDYVDSYFLESNIEFCRRYNLDETHFSVSKHCTKPEILEAIKHEQIKRIDSNYVALNSKELVGIITETFFKYYKIQKANKTKNNSTGIRLIWNSISELVKFK